MNAALNRLPQSDFDGQLHHIALVTDRLEASVQGLLAMGARPLPAVAPRGALLEEQYRGEAFVAAETMQQVKVTLGGLVIEVFEPNLLPSPWREGLDAKGPGLHHIGYAVEDVAASLQRQLDLGADLICHVSFRGEMRACYFTRKDVDMVIEFIKPA